MKARAEAEARSREAILCDEFHSRLSAGLDREAKLRADVAAGLEREASMAAKLGAKAGETDMINAPPHYRVGGFECLEVIEALGLDYHLGSAFAYLWRAGRKGDAVEDLEKARFYLDRAIARRTATEPKR